MWHGAMLARQDPKHFPSLGDMTGEARTKRAPGQSPAELRHNIKLFKAALAAGKGK